MSLSVEESLAATPFFAGLESGVLELLGAHAREVRFDAGEQIFRRGSEADRFFLIRHGTVALEAFSPTRHSLLIETLEDGEVLGWSWLFPPYRWHFDAQALSPVAALAFDAAEVRRLCEANAELGRELMRRFAQVVIERLQWTRLRLIDVYGNGERH
jgi:CRP-like cAMP-binding protein